MGAARGHPGGAPLAWPWGVRGRALSHPRPPVLWGVRPGLTTHWLRVRGMRAWGPVTNPTARALASWLGALWGRQEAPGGAPSAWVWGVRGPALSQPRPPVLWGVRPRPATHWLWLQGGVGVGARHHPHSARSCELALRAVGAARGRPGGGRLLPACGAFRFGRSRTPDCRSFGACGRGPLPTGCGCGGRGRGAPSPTPQRALLRAGFARCGGGMTAPGGGAPLVWVRGVRGRALSHPRPPVLWGVRPGPTTHWLWMRGVRAWGPVTNPTARALASWLCSL